MVTVFFFSHFTKSSFSLSFCLSLSLSLSLACYFCITVPLLQTVLTSDTDYTTRQKQIFSLTTQKYYIHIPDYKLLDQYCDLHCSSNKKSEITLWSDDLSKFPIWLKQLEHSSVSCPRTTMGTLLEGLAGKIVGVQWQLGDFSHVKRAKPSHRKTHHYKQKASVAW